MKKDRLIAGWIILVAGILMTIACFFTTFFMLIYSLPIIVVGIIILLNKKEDTIERRKDLKEKNYNK